MVSLTDLRNSVSEDQSTYQKFDGVKIPFLTLAHGRTRLQFLSELDVHEGTLPPVTLYRYYKPAEAIDKGNYKIWEFAYKEGDEFEPSFVAKKNEEGRKINPSSFAIKGFAYVVNLTALKAISLFLERGGDENTPVGEGKNALITSKDFGGIKFADEVKAARTYIQNYQEVMKRAKANNVELPTYHGIHIYNFNATVAKAIGNFITTLEADGEDMESIRLTDWVFALTREGQGLKTEYTFSIDYPVSEIDESLVEPTHNFLEESDDLSDFSGLIDRKRYKVNDDLPEEVKFSNMPVQGNDTW